MSNKNIEPSDLKGSIWRKFLYYWLTTSVLEDDGVSVFVVGVVVGRAKQLTKNVTKNITIHIHLRNDCHFDLINL